eukprot:741231-Karenia_brevis.AAC.1
MPHKRSYHHAPEMNWRQKKRLQRDAFYHSSPGQGKAFVSVEREDWAAAKSFAKARSIHRAMNAKNGHHRHNASQAISAA